MRHYLLNHDSEESTSSLNQSAISYGEKGIFDLIGQAWSTLVAKWLEAFANIVILIHAGDLCCTSFPSLYPIPC